MNYRVWCVNKNEWEKDEVAMLQNGNLVQVRNMQPLRKETHIVEFSTGMKDKNGVQMHVGDIFTTDTEDGLYKMVMEFVYDEYYFGSFVGKPIEEMEYDENYEGGMEVIGNIHENKELLEDYNGKTV